MRKLLLKVWQFSLPLVIFAAGTWLWVFWTDWIMGNLPIFSVMTMGWVVMLFASTIEAME